MPSEEKSSHEAGGGRVESVHGGETVEVIEKPEAMNNPDCEHEWERDLTETDFVAYKCVKDKCGIITL